MVCQVFYKHTYLLDGYVFWVTVKFIAVVYVVADCCDVILVSAGGPCLVLALNGAGHIELIPGTCDGIK